MEGGTMTPRGHVALIALCGTAFLAGWGAATYFGSVRTEGAGAPIVSSRAEEAAASAAVEPARVQPAVAAEDTPPVVASEDTPPAATSEHARQAPPSEDDVAV